MCRGRRAGIGSWGRVFFLGTLWYGEGFEGPAYVLETPNCPDEVLQKGLAVRIEEASASRNEDKVRILNSMRLRHAQTAAFLSEPPMQHESYEKVNQALASHFALASYFGAVINSREIGMQPLLWALADDVERSMVELSLTGCANFGDNDLRVLLQHLPPKLRALRLDLAFTHLEFPFELQEAEIALPSSLARLAMRFAGSYGLRSTQTLPALMRPLRLEQLELWFSHLPVLQDIGPLGPAIAAQKLEALVLQVDRCPHVDVASKAQLRLSCRPPCKSWDDTIDLVSSNLVLIPNILGAQGPYGGYIR